MTVSDEKVVEALLLLADEPVPSRVIGEVLESPVAQVEGLLRRLAESYAQEDRGFVLREVGGGWRLYTSRDCRPWLEAFVRRSRHARLTAAALEVLAIVAYRQPIARSQIAQIRGTDSDGVVRTLIHRGLLRECGRHSGPGAPVVVCVTDEFLERLGLRTLDELPPLSEFMPDADAVEDMEAKLSPST